MKTVIPDFKALAIALTLALTLNPAGAQEQTPAPVTASEPGLGPGVQPPPAHKPARRRSVQQVIEPTPRIATDGERPTLMVGPAPPPGAPAGQAAPPHMPTCGPGGCFDTGGTRFNGSGGAGNTLLSPKGQLCIKGVVNAQCF